MKKTKIDWQNPEQGWSLDYVCNTVIGCNHNCQFECWAKRLNNRFHWIADWNKPEVQEKAFYKPFNEKKPSTFFVVSLGDLFGDWIPKVLIETTLIMCENNPHHRFLFLTKNPKRYLDFEFTENCWLGTSVSCDKDINRVLIMNQIKQGKNVSTFVSVEPLLGSFEGISFTGIDLIIVGAQSGKNAVKPKAEWIKSIRHKNIYYKQNIRKYI